MQHKAQMIVIGKFARKHKGERWSSLTLLCELEDRSPRIDMVAFDATVRAEIDKLEQPMEVKLSGRIGMTTVKARGGKPVIIDGYEKWVPQLIIDEILEVSTPGKAEEGAPAEYGNPPSDDDIPF